MSGLKQRSAQVSDRDDSGDLRREYDPLAVLDEPAGDASPLDDAEQAEIMASLRSSQEKSSYIFRALMLFLLVLCAVAYTTPLPAYIMGTHPENHMTMFWAGEHFTGSHEDLMYLPAFPIYLGFALFQGLLLFAAARETADQMGLIKGTTSRPFPAQPHLYGTAPEWLVPSLRDLKFAPMHMSGSVTKRADGSVVEEKQSLSSLQPRLIYLFVLAVASLPLPLMVFGAGSFANAAWWSLSSAALVLLCLVEYSIGNSERGIKGLDGRRYGYKGA